MFRSRVGGKGGVFGQALDPDLRCEGGNGVNMRMSSSSGCWTR